MDFNAKKCKVLEIGKSRRPKVNTVWVGKYCGRQQEKRIWG